MSVEIGYPGRSSPLDRIGCALNAPDYLLCPFERLCRDAQERQRVPESEENRSISMIDSTSFVQMSSASFYHCVIDATAERVNSVLENGLERTTTHFSGMWQSRPKHVYMGDVKTVKRAVLNSAKEREVPYAIFRVDCGLLDRRKVNADEDHFITQNFYDFRQSANVIGGRHACEVFHRPFPPSEWMWEWTQYMGWRALPTLGEWAEQVDLGSNPAETRYSMLRGSIAYEGVVPPKALSLLTSKVSCFA